MTNVSLHAKIDALQQGPAHSRTKGQIVSILGHVGHMGSVASTTQLCPCSKKTAINFIHSSEHMETAKVCISG